MIPIFFVTYFNDYISAKNSSFLWEQSECLVLSHTFPLLILAGRINVIMLIVIFMRLSYLLKQNFAVSKIGWRQKGPCIELLIPNQALGRNIIIFLSQSTTFAQLVNTNVLRREDLIYPEGIDPDTSVMNFLLKQQRPMQIQLMLTEGSRGLLKNLASRMDSTLLRKFISHPKSIYRHIQEFKRANSQSTKAELRDFLTRYYLKLEVEYYTKINRIPLKTPLTPTIKEQLLNYLNQRNETSQQELLLQITRQMIKIKEGIDRIQFKKKQIEKRGDKLLGIYKWGAASITAAHIVSFGYMIFFVDWLGWDIIEPLTYSVSWIYLILGIRFYRKFKKDRDDMAVNDRLRRMVLKQADLTLLQGIQETLRLQKRQLQALQQRQQILKNRLSFQGTMGRAFKGVSLQ